VSVDNTIPVKSPDNQKGVSNMKTNFAIKVETDSEPDTETVITMGRACKLFSYLEQPDVLMSLPQPHRLAISELLHGGFTQRFPLEAKPIKGMVCSLPGVLNRAAEHCQRSKDSNHLSFPLGELLRHINHLRASESDEHALGRLEEFLRLWVE